ncbi:phytoene/squalene synthase family protein [uncultured Amnibacterium sp.]|uniref:phytoene/squalene synthase family protein n=1 Tax=uncultured Amnibacterium sp. TaxID=1631851 RepID=UPI0035CAB764
MRAPFGRLRVTTPLQRYNRAAERSAGVVIGHYSTSFGLATRLLPAPTRTHIRNVYALVRLADEIVDGVAAESGLDRAEVAAALELLERQTEQALATGYSTNLVVHAFGRTARDVGIELDVVTPFFTSMRMDVHQTVHDDMSFATYVDGSAEVVGLMCLRAFLAAGPPTDPATRARLESGARRLGAAFQKVNFLRDLAADAHGLGRSYFPGVEAGALDEPTKHRLLDDIDADLAAAATTLPLLPRGPRRAVALAHGLFAELSARLRRTPATVLQASRVRVPDPVKVRLAALAVADRLPRTR